MPIYEVEHQGRTRRLEVDAAFAALPGDQQVTAALDIIAKSGAAAPAEASFGDNLQAGLAGAAQGIGQTIGLVAPETGAAISGAVSQPENYRSPGREVVEGVRNFDGRRIIDNIGGAVTEALPDMAGTLAAARLGGMVGGVGGPIPAAIGAAVGAGGYTAMRAFGPNVQARAANNGRPGEPTTSDIVGAIPGTAAQTALGVVGARGLNPLAAARAPAATMPQGLAPRAAELGRTSLREGASEVPESIVEQAGQTLGTASGLSVDPAEAIAAGITGTATRGALGAPGAVARGGAESVAVAAAERMAGDMSPERAASFVRTAGILERQAAATGRDVEPTVLLNTAHGTITQQVLTLLRDARRANWITERQQGEVRELFESARRHNKELPDGTVVDDGDGGVMGLRQLEQLDAPPQFQAALRDLFQDVNTLAEAGRKKNVSGPFEKLFDLVGRGAAIGGGFAAGGPMGAVAGAALSIGANPLPARIGALIGRQVDRMAGTRMPVVMLAQRKARGIVEKAGIDPGDAGRNMTEAQTLLADDVLARRAALGLDTTPGRVSSQTAGMIRKRLANGLEVPDAMYDRLTDGDLGALKLWGDEQDALRDAAAKASQAAQVDDLNAGIDGWKAQSEAEQNPNPLEVRARNAKLFTKVEPKAVDPAKADARIEADRIAAEALRAKNEAAGFGEIDKARAAEDVPLDRQVKQVVAEVRAAESNKATTAATLRKAQDAERAVREERLAAEQADANMLASRSRADQTERTKGIEQGYAARNRQASKADDAYDRALAAVEDQKVAELESTRPPEADPNLDAVYKSETAEWDKTLRLLDARSRLKAAQAPPKAAPVVPPPASAPEPVAPPAAPPQAQPAAPPPVTPQAPPPVAPPVAPSVPPPAPPSAPPAERTGPRKMPAGWAFGIMKFAFNERAGTVLSADDVSSAAKRLHDRGEFSDDEFSAIQKLEGDMPRGMMEAITAEALDAAGVDPMNPFAGAQGPAPGGAGRTSVRDMPQWKSAADSYQMAASRAQMTLLDRGDVAGAEAAGTMAVATLDQLPGNQRVFIVETLIEDATPEQVAARRAMLRPLIAKYRSNDDN